MKTFIKISSWIMIGAGLLFMLASIILAIMGWSRIGHSGNLTRLLIPRLSNLISALIQGLLLVGVGEVIQLLQGLFEKTGMIFDIEWGSKASTVKKK